MVLIGEEYVRRELEFIPATCKVIEYYSQSYGCPSCKEGLGDTERPVIAKSQVPKALVGKGPATASAVAWTMYQKYANGLPLYRQEKDWKAVWRPDQQDDACQLDYLLLQELLSANV